MKITVIGTGFVGVVSACVYAHQGNEVVGLDIDKNKIEKLQKSLVPFYEPDLEKLLKSTQKLGQLIFTTDYKKAISSSEVIIIAVGTPSTSEGNADLTYVLSACETLAPYLQAKAVIAVKSTVPPGTLNQIEAVISKHTKVKYYLASLPEFLREGKAVADTLNPDRIVIGATDKYAFDQLEKLHHSFQTQIIKVNPESAQMGKYAANAYLATRITFINQIANLCEKNGADVNQVINIIGKDQRIGEHYWYPGFGYGGSCFPKDVMELAAYSRSVGETDNLLVTIHDLNQARIPKLLDKIEKLVGGWSGKKAAVLGLSFKPFTDDMRRAPSIKTIEYLLNSRAEVTAYDPKALEAAGLFIQPHSNLKYSQKIAEACKESDVIIALVEWPEIVKYNFSKVRKQGKKQWFVDARNQFSSDEIESLGFRYIGVGK